MLIKIPNTNYVSNYTTTDLKSPRDPNWSAPLVILDKREIRMEDEELMAGITQYAPDTKYRPGDLAMLKDTIPRKLTVGKEEIPRIWEVRFVLSKWSMEAMLTIQSRPDVNGIDHLIALVEHHGGLLRHNYNTPIIYAHGYPHGMYPNTAAFLADWNLRRIAIREPIVGWQEIVEESGAPFFGYDQSEFSVPYGWELAPDLYGSGHKRPQPFRFEEKGVQTLCENGFEAFLFDPIIVGRTRRMPKLDDDHDLFTK